MHTWLCLHIHSVHGSQEMFSCGSVCESCEKVFRSLYDTVKESSENEALCNADPKQTC